MRALSARHHGHIGNIANTPSAPWTAATTASAFFRSLRVGSQTKSATIHTTHWIERCLALSVRHWQQHRLHSLHWLINNLCVLSLEPTRWLALRRAGRQRFVRALVMPIIARLLNYCHLRNNDLLPSSQPIRSVINTPDWHSLARFECSSAITAISAYLRPRHLPLDSTCDDPTTR